MKSNDGALAPAGLLEAGEVDRQVVRRQVAGRGAAARELQRLAIRRRHDGLADVRGCRTA
jgi:hypothetical protein